jgi:hypothetical protein
MDQIYQQQEHRSHPLYGGLTALLLLLTAVLTWSTVRDFSREGIFFLLIMVGVTLWFARLIGNRVVLDERSLTLQAPLRQPRRIEFRQLVSVSESGRLLVAPTLIYHPQEPTGLVDLERVQSLTLPALTRQEQLLATLTATMPK